ncbi:MAG: elongation factor P [Candidatus Dadabacteria bacterium]|nr:elongation factor P [Candidatus Dadabacteria bacterium]
MGVVGTNQFHRGLKIEYEGEIWEIIEYRHSKMAQRSAVMKTKIRNVATGAVQEKNFRSGDSFKVPDTERKSMQFLYKDEIGFHFMDTDTYEQYGLSPNEVGESADFLKEQQEVTVLYFNGKPMGVDLPTAVELAIVETEPGMRGDTVTGATKPAVLESGATIQVPLFIDQGDVIKVDTRSGEYLERIKKK